MKNLLVLFSLLFSLLLSSNAKAQLVPDYDDIMIPMSDGEFLEADVYIPSGCVSCEVVLVQTPYNKDLLSWSLPMGIGLNLDAQQFIWVIVDWRGFYGSSGASLVGLDRGQDAYDICDWIVAQPWHGSRIGTWGPSALGNIQYQLLAKQHPNHTCAIPIVAHAQFAYDGYFYGGVLEEARLQQLDALGYGLTPTIMANTYYNTTWQFAETSTDYANDITIPTLQIGGWYDHNIDKMMTLYKDCRAQAPVAVQDEQWLLVGPWVHGGTGVAYVGTSVQGELTYPNAAFKNDSMSWDFFEYYLLDSINNWQSTPQITYYELGTDIWKTSAASDIAAIGSNVLYLNSVNRLTSANGNGATSFNSDPNNPTPTIGGATLHSTLDQGPYDQVSLDSRSDLITFETAVLNDDVNALGRIFLNLYVSSNQPDCDIAVRIVDVYPDGRNMLITDGIKRMRFRTGYYASNETFMSSGTVYPVQIDLPFTNYTWLAGHKIKIYISGNHAVRWYVNLQNGGPMYTAGTANIAAITIHHDATYPSKITLPGNNPSLAINENDNNIDILIYPNPTTNELYIQSNQAFQAYSIFDLSGRQVVANVNFTSQISTDILAPGIYILQLTHANGETYLNRFVKK